MPHDALGRLQIIEFTTSRADELNALLDEWLENTEGKRTAIRGTQCRDRDRDRDNTWVQIVDFPSSEAAMTNSALPETGAVAGRLAELCDEPPTFWNLDVNRDMQMVGVLPADPVEPPADGEVLVCCAQPGTELVLDL